MNTFTAEDRTGTYPQRRDIYWRPGPGDEQFERQLPPELHAKLEGAPQRYPLREIAPPYLRPAPASRPETVFRLPPVRPPESEAEIELALQWLKSQGYLRSTSPAPSSVPAPKEVAIPTASEPARGCAPRSGTGIWLLLAALIGLPLLLARVAGNTQPQPQGQPVEVRRALPVVEVRKALPAVPRALPVTSALSTVPMHSGSRSGCLTARSCRLLTRVNCPPAQLCPPEGVLLARSTQPAIPHGSG